MEILKLVLTWVDMIIMVVFIALVAIQTSRSEGIHSRRCRQHVRAGKTWFRR